MEWVDVVGLAVRMPKSIQSTSCRHSPASRSLYLSGLTSSFWARCCLSDDRIQHGQKNTSLFTKWSNTALFMIDRHITICISYSNPQISPQYSSFPNYGSRPLIHLLTRDSCNRISFRSTPWMSSMVSWGTSCGHSRSKSDSTEMKSHATINNSCEWSPKRALLTP